MMERLAQATPAIFGVAVPLEYSSVVWRGKDCILLTDGEHIYIYVGRKDGTSLGVLGVSMDP